MVPASLGPDYFERLYSATPDPWNFATSPYEHAKYRATLEMLGTEHFRSALEIGCSVGVLTAMLAPRCDDLLAVDINDRALEAARDRCAGLPSVRFVRMALPTDFPAEHFDLVVLSEVAYYWSDADLHLAIDRIAGAASGGTLELVHFLPKVEDYVRSGDDVHEAFLGDARLRRIRGVREERFRIDVLAVR